MGDLCYHRRMIDIDAIARGFHAAFRAGALYAAPSASLPLDLGQAYAVQDAFNALRAAEEPIAGYKAGVNAQAAQRALALEGPITGALFARGARSPGAVIERGAFRNLVIETEVGFRTSRRIDRPIDTLAELRASIATIAAMFELADPGFGRVPLKGTDMVAANVACGGFVEGPAHAVAGIDLNAVSLVLRRDGVVLHEARAADLLGDHWQALAWLINALVARGLVIDAGQLLMTGALGSAQPATPGVYEAAFTTLGTIAITIV